MRKLCISLLAAAALCGGARAEEPAAGLEDFLARADVLTADFRQVLRGNGGPAGGESSGRFYVNRPGKFRWEYLEPAEQLVVSDGARLWMYDADLEQVTVRSVDDGLEGTPAMLLSGQGRLADSFEVGAAYAEDGLEWVELRPLAERPEFRGLRVAMKGDAIAAMEVIDNLEQVTRIEFDNVRLGGPVDESLFRFEPPPGVDVIGGEGF